VVDGFVNVDISSLPGIARAKDMRLVETGLVDAIVTSHLHEGSALFTDGRRGRLFTVMRHPVETAVSLFYYLGYATWERTYRADFANMTLAEYAAGPHLLDNWITRYLTHEETGELTEWHVELASEILSKKCVVGIVDELDETMKRLQSYFGWEVMESFPDCLHHYIHERAVNTHKHQKINSSSPEWHILEERNKFDIRVYEIALALFEEQAQSLIPRYPQPNT